MSAWLVLGIVACAVGAIGARRLLHGVLWLAATSVLLATLLATIGAPIVAVIEVSVGAGLVAVLFVFTIGIAGEEGLHARPIVPKPLALGLVVPATLLLLWLTLPAVPVSLGPISPQRAMAALAGVLWNDRAADLLGQAALIVVAALAVRTILGSDRTAPVAAPVRTARREIQAVIESALAGDVVVVAKDDDPAVRTPDATSAVSSAQAEAREEVRT